MVVRCNLGVLVGWIERGGSWDSKAIGLDRIGAMVVEVSRVEVEMLKVGKSVHTGGTCTPAGERLRFELRDEFREVRTQIDDSPFSNFPLSKLSRQLKLTPTFNSLLFSLISS